MDSRKRNILIIENNPLMRRGYVSLLQAEPDLQVCGEVASLQEALDLLRDTRPDLVLLNFSVGGMCAIEFIKQLATLQPRPRVLAISLHENTYYIERAFHAGIHGHLSARESEQQLLQAIRKILKGGTYLSEEIGNRLLCQFSRRRGVVPAPLERLSDREFETFELIGKGYSTRQIAEIMNISPKTVESHRGRIKAKLTLGSTSELRRNAVLWVYRHHLN